VPRFIVVGRLLVLHRLKPDASGHRRTLAGLTESSGRPVEAARNPAGRVRLRVEFLQNLDIKFAKVFRLPFPFSFLNA